ncbi:HNH endonuclease [Bacillus cereus]|uniref:HNH endonuclease n=1 Tax=Bacillus cereus TaxID=1396 RepID=UPI0035700777
MPDFSALSKGEVEIEMTPTRDGLSGNYQKADEALAKKLSTPEMTITRTDIQKWRIANDYTWHELNDCKTIQLIPTDINGTFKHLGGVGELKKKIRLGE